MKRIFLILVTIVATFAVEAGNTNEPFTNAVSKVAGAGSTATNCVIQHEPTAARLRAITVPAINFKNAAMSDVVEFLANSWSCIGHPWVYPEQAIQGDTVIYSVPMDSYDPDDPHSSPTLLKGTNVTYRIRLGPEINLHTNQITLLDLFGEVVRQAAGTMVIKDELIIIKTKKVDPPRPREPQKPREDIF